MLIAAAYGLKSLADRSAKNREKLLWIVCLILVAINFGGFKTFEITRHHLAGYEVLRKIPDQTSVLAQVDLIPHLPKRDRIYLLDNNALKVDAEYVILDTQGNKWPLSQQKYQEIYSAFANSVMHRLVVQKDGYYVFKRL